MFFEYPEEVVDENAKVITPTDNQYHKKIKGYQYNNTFESIEGYVDIHEAHLTVDKFYDPELNKIVNCSVEIKKGDVMGWSSGDGSSAEKKTVHFEIFIKDDDSFKALKKYTSAQIGKNEELKAEPLLNLDKLLEKGDVKDAYDSGKDTTYVNKILARVFPEEGRKYKDISVEQAKDKDHISSLLRRVVAKHCSEWVSPSQESEKDLIFEVFKNLFFPPQFKAFKQLFFGSLAFWDQLKDENGSPFPDEAYFFHPIKFIEHLRRLELANYILDHAARTRGFKFIEDNIWAYYRGYQYWVGGAPLLVPIHEPEKGALNDSQGYYLVKRTYSKGKLTYISKESRTKIEGQAIITNNNISSADTFCNIAAAVIAEEYGAPNLQYFNNQERSVNAIVNLLESEGYNTDDCIFKNVEYKQAEEYASMGGFAIAIRKGGSHGHIATLVGGYKDNVKTAGNVKTYQAGILCGYTTISVGFGTTDVTYYIWRKK